MQRGRLVLAHVNRLMERGNTFQATYILVQIGTVLTRLKSEDQGPAPTGAKVPNHPDVCVKTFVDADVCATGDRQCAG